MADFYIDIEAYNESYEDYNDFHTYYSSDNNSKLFTYKKLVREFKNLLAISEAENGGRIINTVTNQVRKEGIDYPTRTGAAARAARLRNILTPVELWLESNNILEFSTASNRIDSEEYLKKTGLDDKGLDIKVSLVDIQPIVPPKDDKAIETITGTEAPVPEPPVVPVPSEAEIQAAIDAEEQLNIKTDSAQCKVFRLYEGLANYYNETIAPARIQSEGKLYLNGDILKVAVPILNSTGANLYSMNKNKNSGAMHLFYLKNHVYSSMVPKIEFYKIKKTVNSKEALDVYKIDIPNTMNDSLGKVFIEGAYTATTPEQILKNLNWQIGIKNFEYSFIGTDRFTAERDIKAELTIVAESLEAVFAERRHPDKPSIIYRISDLFISPSCYEKTTPKNVSSPSNNNFSEIGSQGAIKYKPECYEIVAKVGYDVDESALNTLVSLENNTTGGGISDLSYSSKRVSDIPLIKENFNRLQTSLYLVVVDHTIDLKENGFVEIKINYRARLEGSLRDPELSATIPYDANLTTSEIDDFGSLAPKQISDKYLSYSEQVGINFVRGVTAVINPAQAGSEDAANLARGVTGTSGQKKTVKLKEFVKEVEEYIDDAKNRRENASESQDTTSIEEEIKNCEELLKNVYSVYNTSFYKRVEEKLYETNRVFQIDFSQIDTEYKEYVKATPAESYPTLTKLTSAFTKAIVGGLATTTGVGGAIPGIIALYSAINDVSSAINTYPFVYFGDLLDIIFETIRGENKEEYLKDLLIVLGIAKLPSFSTGNVKDPSTWIPISIASVPITLESLKTYTTKVISEKKSIYPLMSVLRDLFNELLLQSMGSTCFDSDSFPKYRPRLLQITDYGNYGASLHDPSVPGVDLDTLSTRIQTYFEPDALLQRGGSVSTDILYMNFEPKNFGRVSNGNFAEDFKNGIAHFIYKSDHGIFKNISLSKTDQPYVKEARFQRANKTNVISQLTNIYDASFETVGNDLFTLGDLVWVDSSALAPSLGDSNNPGSLSFIMGLGGLYLVTEIGSSINNDGNFTTKVKCRFVSRGEV